jgi:hypothetical protein
MADKTPKATPTPKPAKKLGPKTGPKLTVSVPFNAELAKAMVAATGQRMAVVVGALAGLFTESNIEMVETQLRAMHTDTGSEQLASVKAKLFHPEQAETPSVDSTNPHAHDPLASDSNV